MTHPYGAPLVLITMPHSHYSEKARWALDWLSLPYREQPHVPLLHRLATTRRGGGSVPLLVHGAERFIDSTDIMIHADAIAGGDRLYPRDEALGREVAALEERFDEELGPHARRWAYAHLLPDVRLLQRLMTRGTPWHEARILTLIMPKVRGLIRSSLKITPESTSRSLERVRGVFCAVDERLGDGRTFLACDRFTAADLTFASLAAPVLFPPEYRAAYPALDDAPAAVREEALRLRETRAGRFALALFAQERNSHCTRGEEPEAR